MDETSAQPDLTEPVISIGALARKVGKSVSAVRKYENEGLVLAHRTPSGHRFFSHEDIRRVQSLQHLMQELGLNVAGIRRMLALLPCWDLLPCPADTRARCPAYGESSRPCWTIKGLSCPPQGNECRRCAVYRFGLLCLPDLKRLLHGQDDLQNGGNAMKELLRRKRLSKKEEA
jgi:MerR family transcriptional regulator/heat shock protein HspR